MPKIFQLLQEWGNVDWREMYRTFNCGIGMILIVDAESFPEFAEDLTLRGESFYKIGRVVEGDGVKILGGVFGE